MVPKGWSHKTVGEICHFVNGNGFKASEWDKKGLPIIRIQNLNGSEEFNYFNGVIKQKWLVNTGDILFAWAGTKGVSFGAKRWFGPQGVLNQHIFRVEPLVDVDKEWLYLALLKVTQRVEEMAHGFKATLLHVQKGDITDQVINIPPLSEQKKIAQILSTWDKAITTTERLLDLARQQKKALMQQLLTGKKRFPGFEGLWLRKSLGEFGEIKSAGVDKKIVDGEIPVRLLNYTDVFKRNFIYSSELNHWVSAPPQKVVGCNVKCGDVFFTPSSETREDVGIPAVAAEDIDECCYSYHVVRFRIKEKWDLNFKAYAFTTPIFRSQVTTLADGSGQRYVVSQDSFRSIVVHYPLYEEQVRIGAAIKTAEDEEKIWERKISCLKNEKKALMQALLTGKRRVSVDN